MSDPPASTDPVEYLQKVLERQLSNIDPERYLRLKGQAENFWRESKIVSDAQLINIDDLGVIFLPRSCHLEQLIVQVLPNLESEPRYFVNLDAYEMLSIEGQAAAILHELLYRELIPFSPPNSLPARTLTALIFSDNFHDYLPDRYQRLLSRLGFGSH